MPRYDYSPVDPEKSCDHCRDGFEVAHGMNDPAPQTCPECGNPAKRSWHQAPYVSGGRWSSKRLLNKDNLHKHGFKTGTDLLEDMDSKK